MFFSKKTPKNFGLGFLILLVLLVIMALVAILTNDVEAKGLPRRGDVFDWNESWQPPRGEVSLNLLGEFSPGGVKSRLQGVCYDVLEEKNKPYYIYLGAGFQTGNLEIEPALGWSFRDNEWVLALRTYPDWGKSRAYSNLEYQLETQSYYWVAKIETHLNHFIEWGVEAEGWGDLDDYLTSNGAGLNLVFHLQGRRRYGDQDSKLQIEAAVQYREMDGSWKPQAIVRFNFTPKLDEHSRSRRRH